MLRSDVTKTGIFLWKTSRKYPKGLISRFNGSGVLLAGHNIDGLGEAEDQLPTFLQINHRAG